MSGKSNAKGSSFERLICRRLTEWITGKPIPEIFWRSATSGAKATVDRKAGRDSNMGGDIVAIDPAGQPFIDRYSVECKNRKSYGRLENVIAGKGELLEWWVQCARDAELAEKIPLLIYKAKGTPVYIAHPMCVGFAEPRLVFTCTGYNEGVGIVLFEDWLWVNRWDFLRPNKLVHFGFPDPSTKPPLKKVGK